MNKYDYRENDVPDEPKVLDSAKELNKDKDSLTDWKNPPTLANLKQDLQDAQPSHSKHKQNVGTWLDNLNVTGKAKVVTPEGNSAIVPKLIRKQAEWRYAALTEPFLSTTDVFNISPVTWEDAKAAEQNQLVLNNQFNTQIQKVRFIDEYIRTAVDEGSVIVKVGWEFYEEPVKEVRPIVSFRQNPQVVQQLQQIAGLQQESPSQFATDVPEEWKQALQLSIQQQVPIEPVVTGQEEIEVMKTIINRPTVEVCDYRNVIIDPTCKGDLSKAGFIIFSFESSLSQLEKDGKYSNLDKIQVTANSPLAEPDHHVPDNVGNFNFSDKPRTKFVVFEYWGFWDIDDTGIVKPIVASWVGNTLIRMGENPFPDKKLPFVLAQYLPVRRSIFGEPDGVLIEDNQKIVGAVTRGMIDIMGKSANGQTGIRKDMLDVTNRRKFDKGQDYEFNANVDPRQGIHMHTYPEIPQSAGQLIQLNNNEAESLTGVRSFSQGISGKSLGDVAVGVRGALDAASKRELGILRRLSAGIEEIGRKIISMNAEFLSEEEVVRITNDQFVTVRRDDLPGNFDLTLSISTAEEDQNKAQELAFLLQTTGNTMDPILTRMILSDIAKLRKMPELAKRIRDYQPQPDPIQQAIQQAQLALLQAQVATEQAKTQHTSVDSGLKAAKTTVEQAKAAHLSADTDQKNLDFVEQEAGVKQERDLQKQDMEAQNAAKLKFLEHNLGENVANNDLIRNSFTAKP